MKWLNLHMYSLPLLNGFSKVFLFLIIAILLINTKTSAQNNFIPGEELKYNVSYGPINAGIANIFLIRTIYNNQPVFYSKMAAQTIGLPDKIYKVKDAYECYFDSVTILPLMAVRDIREGRYKKKNIDTYDYNKNSVLTLKKGEIKISAGVRDVISTYYFLRNYDFSGLKKGDVITMDIFFNDEIITFKVHYLGKETIDSKIGKINCIKLQPEMMDKEKNKDTENVSPTPKDDMTIWLSDDPNQVPVRVKFELFIGSIKADLTEYINLKY